MSSDFLVLPLKKTKHATLKQDLYRFLTQSYSEEVVNIHKDAVTELDALRTKCQELKDFKSSFALSLISTYLFQLLDLYPKICDSSCSFGCTFVWFHSYEKSSLISSATKNASSDLSFEIANVAHLLMSVIWNQSLDRSLTNEDDLKKSLQDFQALSGMFRYFSDYASSYNLYALLSDLNPDLLSIYADLSFANAHEMMFHRAQNKNMSNSVFVVICKKLIILYQSAVSHLKAIKSSQSYLKDILKFCESRIYFFKAIMNYKQCVLELEAKNYSLYVSRAIAAKEFYKEALKMWPCNLIMKMETLINDKGDEAFNDNRCIYNEQIIASANLPEIETADIMQEKKFEPEILKNWISHCAYSDAFCYLHSRSVAKLVVNVNKRKDEIAHQKNKILEDFNVEMQQLFVSFNVPACLEEHKPGNLPPSLLNKMQIFKDYGGVNRLRTEVDNIAELRKMNIEMLNALQNDLKAEAKEDEIFAINFPHDNRILRSNIINQSYLSNAHYIEDKLDQAKTGDESLVNKFADVVDKLAVLSRSPHELAFETAEQCRFNPEETRKIERLKELYKAADEIVAERAHIMTLFYKREDRSDLIQNKLKTKTPEEAHLIVDEIALSDFSHALQLFEVIKVKHGKFVNEFSSIANALDLKKRVNGETYDIYQRLATYFNYFEDTVKHIRQGQEFHPKLQNMLLTQQDEVKDFFESRKIQRMMTIERERNNHINMNNNQSRCDYGSLQKSNTLPVNYGTNQTESYQTQQYNDQFDKAHYSGPHPGTPVLGNMSTQQSGTYRVNVGIAQQPSVHPPHGSGYAQQSSTYLPQRSGHPQQAPLYPPQGVRYPQQAPLYSPQGVRYVQQAAVYPPQGVRYSQQAPVLPPQDVRYAQQGSVYPPQRPGYPSQGNPYQQQRPGYPSQGNPYQQHRPGNPPY